MDTRRTLERLVAIDAVRDLVNSYSHLIDRGEFAAVAALFADASYGQCDEDGVPRGTPIDRDADAVQRAMETFVAVHGDPPTPRTAHVTTNVRVTVSANNSEASAVSYVTVLQSTADLSLQPILVGRYFDRFESVDGRWRFTQRLCSIDHTGDLTGHAQRVLRA